MFCAASIYNFIFLARNAKSWRRWLGLPSCLLVFLGAGGFFGQALSAVGGLDWLPRSFEWPAGRAESALTTSGEIRVVLIKGAGRVQVYDSNWHFLLGWPVRNPLRLRLINDHAVEVLTKGERGFTYDLTGNLLSQARYRVPEWISLQDSLPLDESVWVPTRPELFFLSSPLWSWLLLAAGFAGWFFARPKPAQRGTAGG